MSTVISPPEASFTKSAKECIASTTAVPSEDVVAKRMVLSLISSGVPVGCSELAGAEGGAEAAWDVFGGSLLAQPVKRNAIIVNDSTRANTFFVIAFPSSLIVCEACFNLIIHEKTFSVNTHKSSILYKNIVA